MIKRKEFIDRLAEKGYTKRSAEMILDDFIRVIEEALVEGEDVMFHGFGTFYSKEVLEKESLNVYTGERYIIPRHRIPRFTPGKRLRKWVRDGIIRE